jgi:hypothetical protein
VFFFKDDDDLLGESFERGGGCGFKNKCSLMFPVFLKIGFVRASESTTIYLTSESSRCLNKFNNNKQTTTYKVINHIQHFEYLQ